MSILRWMRHLS